MGGYTAVNAVPHVQRKVSDPQVAAAGYQQNRHTESSTVASIITGNKRHVSGHHKAANNSARHCNSYIAGFNTL